MEHWADIRRRILIDGTSKRQVLRETGMHWKTLKKILENSTPPGYRQARPRAKRKLGPYVWRIEQILKEDKGMPKKQRHTAKRITALLEARESRTLQRSQKQLERLDVLILDELGYVPFSKAGAELLFEVISRAYERTSLILTTNLPFENWTEVLGSERLTGAMLDRLTHRVHILEANGESFRLKDAKKRLKSH